MASLQVETNHRGRNIYAMKVGEDVILIIIFSLVPLDATHLSPPIFAEEEKKKRLKNERQTQSDALYAVGDSRERERKKERERRDWAGRNRKSTNKYSTSQVPNQVQVLSRPVPFSFPQSSPGKSCPLLRSCSDSPSAVSWRRPCRCPRFRRSCAISSGRVR